MKLPAVPQAYTRLQGALPKRDQLPAYAGAYFSPDADVRWRILSEDGRLLLTTAEGWRIPLDAAGADRFIVGPWTLRFVRSETGAVRGLEVHRERLWNLWFGRE